MCGIAGIVRWNGKQPEHSEIERMTAALAHRGPDGRGVFLREGVALGHRRLAIIDPEFGQQPMANHEKSTWITYNGELYNYKELRQDLVRQGHKFETNSDTEVVIHAYDEWGPECVRKFRGMFAFAIADFRKQQLFLARDHFGIKPLFYRVGKQYAAFASELSALKSVDDECPTGNLSAIELYLRFQYIPTPHTIYHGVSKLPPATYLIVGFDGIAKEPVRYWNLAFQAEHGIPDVEWTQQLEAVLNESVRAHLVADVPFGVFLSGGVDSTLIAQEMSRILEHPVKAFAIGFKEEGYSELEFAEKVAKQCGIELHTAIVEDDSLDFLPELVAHYGEPFGDSSAIPTWHVSRLARDFVPMVLSGDGGDEAFGGYGSYEYWMKTEPSTEAKRLLRSATSAVIGLRPRLASSLLQQSAEKYREAGKRLSAWQQLIRYVHDEPRRDLWRSDYRAIVNQECELFRRADREARHLDRLTYAQYLDYQTYLPCDILTKVDVASMYHGLEVRTPLIDLRVIDLATRLPVEQRFRSNGSLQPTGKYLLKKLLLKTFPHEFVHRKKQGFAIPRNRWFLPGRSAWRLLNDLLTDRSSRLSELFNRGEITKQINSHNDSHDNSNTLWLLLILGLWLEQNPEVHFT
jgi:asparagine synthase (glutamine-hydrolysing)